MCKRGVHKLTLTILRSLVLRLMSSCCSKAHKVIQFPKAIHVFFFCDFGREQAAQIRMALEGHRAQNFAMAG